MFNKNVFPLRQDSSNSFLSLLSRGRSQDGASFSISCPIIFCWIFEYRCILKWWCNGICSITLRQNKVCIGRAAQLESRLNCRWFSSSTSRAWIQPTSLRPFPQVRDVPLYQFCSFLTLFKAPLTPHPPLRFEHMVDFFDGLGGTLHCSKIGQYKA